YTKLNSLQTSREFYKNHPDKFDFLVLFTEFPVDGCCYSSWIRNQTHGISTPLSRNNGQAIFSSTVFDRGAAWGSAGELEQIVFMGNVPEEAYPIDLVSPPVDPFDPSLNNIQVGPVSGWPVTFDGQTMTQLRRGSNILQDDGEFSRNFPRPNGTFWTWLISP